MCSSLGFISDSWCSIDQCSRPSHSSRPPGTQRNPYNFMGCLAHAKITEQVSDGQVSCIIGFFNHNPNCSSAVMTRIPSIPLHPHVYEIALQQLHSGARCVNFNFSCYLFIHCITPSVTTIQSKNLEMIQYNAYRGMDPRVSRSNSNIQYEFLPHDGSYLYCLFN